MSAIISVKSTADIWIPFSDLYLKNEEFRQLFEESKGFCLPHFGDLIETAENKLNDTAEKGVLPEGICTDAGKYGTPAKRSRMVCRKKDYRNKDKDWGNSADSIQRGMQKCAGGYPAG